MNGMQTIEGDFLQKWLPLRGLSVGDVSRFGNFAAVYAFRDSTTVTLELNPTTQGRRFQIDRKRYSTSVRE